MLLFGRTQNSDAPTFGSAIFRAESEDEGRSIMSNDPAVKEGVMRAELYPYKVAGLNVRMANRLNAAGSPANESRIVFVRLP